MHSTCLNRAFVLVMAVLVVGGIVYSVSADLTQTLADAYSTTTPFPTQIFLPKRPETLADIQTLLQEPNEACQLPCFWGIRPGFTTEKEIIEFLQPVAIGNNAPELQYAFKEKPGQESIFYISFGVKDGVVSTTSVILDKPSEWLPSQTLELPHLLSLVTATPSAYLDINITTQRVFLTLTYDMGIMAEYAFQLHIAGETLTKADFRFCPILEQNHDIILRLSNDDNDSMLDEYGIPLYRSRNKIWSIERMTGMKVDKFVKQIVEKPDECIELPSYQGLLRMGYEF